MKRLYLLTALALCCHLSNAQSSLDSTRLILKKYLTYWNADQDVSEEKITRLASQLDSAQNKNISSLVRLGAYQKFYADLLTILQDVDANQLKPQLAFLSAGFINNNSKLQWYPEPKLFTPDNQLPGIKKAGNGSITIIAIAAPGYDGREFEKIIEALGKKCTFWIVTLPGSGNILPYKIPAKKELALHPWFSHVTTGIQDLVKKEKIKNFYLLTHGSSLSITMLMSQSLVKEKILGAISMNSNLPDIRPSRTDPSKMESPEEKRFRVNHHFSISDFGPVKNSLVRTGNKDGYDTKMVQKTFDDLNALTSFYITSRYQDEAYAIDGNDYLGTMPFPLLIINPLYDPLVNVNIININRKRESAWQKAKLNNPGTALYVSSIHGRDFFFFENSQEIIRNIRFFLDKDYAVFNQAPDATNKVMESPAASASQTFGNTSVTIKYSRPAVKGRSVFGSLVPYGKLWRAGANQATEILFTRDVKINGNLLKSGKYSMFVIPEETEWTFIFNTLTDQWGTYQYADTYDVLKVKVKSETAKHEEWLKYTFENLTDASVDLFLSWDTKKSGITIEQLFTKPIASPSLVSLPWKQLLEDVIDDHRTKSSADGKALYYYHDKKSDSIWFKLETHNSIHQLSPAISISLDTDNNQDNGVNWYGTNRSFKVDLMLSVGVTRQGDGYSGFNGLTDAQGIRTQNWINVKENCVTYFFGENGKDFYVGLRRDDLFKGQKKVNLIGSVGSYATWNDDIGETFATIEFD